MIRNGSRLNSIETCCSWGEREYYHVVVCGVSYGQGHYWSLTMDQRARVETLRPRGIAPDE
eukprot:796665-Lingulodinium_polyedra.AAC.1